MSDKGTKDEICFQDENIGQSATKRSNVLGVALCVGCFWFLAKSELRSETRSEDKPSTKSYEIAIFSICNLQNEGYVSMNDIRRDLAKKIKKW